MSQWKLAITLICILVPALMVCRSLGLWIGSNIAVADERSHQLSREEQMELVEECLSDANVVIGRWAKVNIRGLRFGTSDWINLTGHMAAALFVYRTRGD